jgi:hypothetical protein
LGYTLSEALLTAEGGVVSPSVTLELDVELVESELDDVVLSVVELQIFSELDDVVVEVNPGSLVLVVESFTEDEGGAMEIGSRSVGDNSQVTSKKKTINPREKTGISAIRMKTSIVEIYCIRNTR